MARTSSITIHSCGVWLALTSRATDAKKLDLLCLSVTLLNGKDCEHEIAIKQYKVRNDFDTVGLGKVCSCAPLFNFVFVLLKWTYGQIWSFSPHERDTIDRYS